MDETLMLILLVITMLVGSYVAGYIPLIVNLSEDKLKTISIFGAGLLVGTALAVIIPEGIRALYNDSLDNVHLHLGSEPKTLNYKELPKENSFTIGLSLILGFIFMMLVEQVSSRRNDNVSPDKNLTATIGLVVHAAADGIALGAAATTNHHDVEIIVFLAIMLHKAPAAFGLVTFLLHAGIHRNIIRRHLGIFSVSAPLLTLLTYFGIGKEQKETLNTLNATGIAMLFSAGTFLYVATVHVLPEMTQTSPSNRSSQVVQYSMLEQQGTSIKRMKCIELFLLTAGTLTPLFLTVGHHH